jgi:hypothetical protein
MHVSTVYYSGLVIPKSSTASYVATFSTFRKVQRFLYPRWVDHYSFILPYTVYPADIPDGLPLHRLIRKMLVDVLRLFMLAFRVAIVAFTWLVLLPLVMIGAWQSYFHYGSPL